MSSSVLDLLEKKYGLTVANEITDFNAGASSVLNFITEYVNKRFRHYLPEDQYFEVQSWHRIQYARAIDELALKVYNERPTEVDRDIATQALDEKFKNVMKEILQLKKIS
ncbi:hypothetical protein CN918_27065 [Priestia megaterium]|nr:hypothetical protein CN918_27065 [Priestia megaterium]